MLIPQEYPQFNNESALLVVTSRQNATFYYAGDGVLNLIDEIKTPKPHWSDREGLFRTRGGGLVARTGGPVADVDDQALQNFLLELRVKLSKILKESLPQKIYCFAPSHLKYKIVECLPTQEQMLIADLFEGNYLKAKPLKLLEQIKNSEMSEEIPLTTIEAVKILQLPHLKFKAI